MDPRRSRGTKRGGQYLVPLRKGIEAHFQWNALVVPCQRALVVTRCSLVELCSWSTLQTKTLFKQITYCLYKFKGFQGTTRQASLLLLTS
jgi:hypothetical protein